MMSARSILIACAAALLVSAVGPARGAVSDFLPGMATMGDFSRPYRLYVPDNYDPGRSYPLILFLHGAGGRGTDNIKNANEASALLPHIRQPGYEAFILAPQLQTDDNTWWLSGPMQLAMNTIDELIMQYNIDPNRLYMTGVSLGGHGTWQGMFHFVDRFAAGVVVCGWYSTSDAYILKDKPMWVFHGALDATVGVNMARQMVAALEALGGHPIYTEYPEAGHGIAGLAYGTDELYQWLFAQQLDLGFGSRLTYRSSDLGGGLTGYTFVLQSNDGQLLPYSVTLGFQGVNGATIKQIKSGGVAVHKEGYISWDEESQDWLGEGAVFCNQLDAAYDMARDTWVCNPFGDNPVPGINPLTGGSINGFYNASNAFAFSCYSGTGSQLGTDVDVAYVVADGDVSWTGTIVRDNHSYDVAGVAQRPAIPGDFNGDGAVTHGDYTIWADNYGLMIAAVRALHPTWFPGGSYVDGATAITHGLYTTWADNFGEGLGEPLTVGQSSAPAMSFAPVAEAPGLRSAADAELAGPGPIRDKRLAARKQQRLQRAAQRQQRRAARAAK